MPGEIAADTMVIPLSPEDVSLDGTGSHRAFAHAVGIPLGDAEAQPKTRILLVHSRTDCMLAAVQVPPVVAGVML